MTPAAHVSSGFHGRRLLVDGQALQAGETRHRGIGRYVRGLLDALARRESAWRVELVVNAALPPPDPEGVGPGVAVEAFEPPLPICEASREANERFFGDWLAATRPDAVLEPNLFEGGVLVPRFTPPAPLFVCLAHDLIPLRYHEHYLKDARARASYGDRLRQLASADLVLAVSDATRADVLQFTGLPSSRVVTIGGAPDRHAHEAPPATLVERTLAALAIDRPFILHVGGVDRRKNVAGSLRAFAALDPALRSGHLLVIAGSLPESARLAIEAEARRLGVESHLRLTGFVSDDTLRVLNYSCRVALFPSFHEGLGLPVVEALAAGAPLVASNRSAIPEYAGTEASLVDPGDPFDIAAAIERALREPRDRGAEARVRRAAGFTWPATATRALTAIESRLAARRHRKRSERPRVAWISPLPPASSGISDYSADLLPSLAADLSITAVVDDGMTVDQGVAGMEVVLRPGELVEAHAREPFDLFVYHVGNSPLHVHMLDLIPRHAGLTVLHDVQLGGLALHARAAGAWPGRLADELDAEGFADLAAAVRRGETDHDRIAREAALSRTIAAGSEAVIVHSAWSWRAVKPYTSSAVFHIPMGVPQPVVTPADELRPRLRIGHGDYVVATLGEVTPAKRVDRVIRACAALPRRIRARLQVRVAGDVSEAMQQELTALGIELGLADRIAFTGRLSMPDLLGLAHAADACVQLRYPPRGETSAALLRALAAGSACIVTDAGSFSEIPRDVALHVPPLEGEHEVLVDHLVRLHDDRDLQQGVRARAVAHWSAHHRVETAAAAYVAAIHMTIARRRTRDGEWIDGAARALAAAGATAAGLSERWARLRVAARA